MTQKAAKGDDSHGTGTHVRKLLVVTSTGFPGYVLLDSGDGRKLERFGTVTVNRPELQALWRPALSPDAWQRADAVFKGGDTDAEGEPGRWRRAPHICGKWPVPILDITMLCQFSGFLHLGLFPEQLPHWQWMQKWLGGNGKPPRVLNLFAYTGAASLLAARAGAEVTHVDASKKATAWARENQAASKLGKAPIRWMLDDARKFVSREVRRGKTYHLILIDPPKFGRGPAGEVWEVFEHLPALLRDCVALLATQRAALVLTTYAIRASALAIDGLARECFAGRAGVIESGELAVADQAGRLLPTSLFTRWTSDASAI
jgi:23S rRNA (cytosine1962-C5)-methyltransferase